MPEPIDVQAIAPTLGRIPSGLFILTARNGERETGMLASWVQQCSFDPPQISVCIRRDRDVIAWLTNGACFTVNLVGDWQNNFVSHFGKGFSLDQPAFTGLNVQRIEGESPILADALGFLLCRVAERTSAGDHDLFVGTVVGGKLTSADGRPWVHIRKNGLKY
jgi:flavin reductase (DIM6/NTAB) family NADH-FMN oxidoreductase RutF